MQRRSVLSLALMWLGGLFTARPLAQLTTAQRRLAAEEFASEVYVRDNATATLNLDDLQAAMAAANNWLDANAAGYNAALPLPFRTTATNAQKARLLVYVARRRAGL